MAHPVLGHTRSPGPPARFAGEAWSLRRHAPLLGEHNRDVLCDRLGYTKQDLVALRAAGVV